jgi:hypothetical protein
VAHIQVLTPELEAQALKALEKLYWWGGPKVEHLFTLLKGKMPWEDARKQWESWFKSTRVCTDLNDGITCLLDTHCVYPR